MNKRAFVTSQEYPELLDQENWKTIKTYCDNLKYGLFMIEGNQ